MKARARKTILKTTISVVVLLVVFVGAGVLYVLFADKTPPVQSKLKSAQTESGSPLPKPKPLSPKAKEGVAVQAVTSPVQRGSNSSVSVLTNATSICKISVVYDGVPSKDSGLVPKTADPYGNVTWTWTVGDSVPVGTWPISVTCTYHGRPAVVDTSVQVTK